ncbi:MAG: hypothetical protein ACKOA9_08785, partial [Actinomycetota bacterium]
RATRAVTVSVIVAGALVVPATVATGAAPVTAATTCRAGARNGVITAYANVFSRTTQLTADDRAASLDRGDDPAVRALLDGWLASPTGASSTVTVTTVRCTGRNRAAVDAELVLAGTPLPRVLPEGGAVRRGGTWKVATATFCTRMILEDPDLASGGACARRR